MNINLELECEEDLANVTNPGAPQTSPITPSAQKIHVNNVTSPPIINSTPRETNHHPTKELKTSTTSTPLAAQIPMTPPRPPITKEIFKHTSPTSQIKKGQIPTCNPASPAECSATSPLQICQVSPPKKTAQNLPLCTSPLPTEKMTSPLPLQNKYAPLRKPKANSISSTSISGPLFPPGFENLIPSPTKKAFTKKREKKHQKKKEKTKSKSSPPLLPSTRQFPISALEVLQFADEVGLMFDGPRYELENRIKQILSRHKAE